MYTRQNPNLAYIERKMWQYSSTPRIGIVKQLLNKLLVELDAVGESERIPLDDFNLHEQVKHFEMDMIRHALQITNHNQRLAAQMLGIRATIFMPEGAPIPKEKATRGYGADVSFHGRYLEDALAGLEKAVGV